MQLSAPHSARLAPRGAGSRPVAPPAQQQLRAQRPQGRRRCTAFRAGEDEGLLSKLDDELQTGKEASGSAGKGFGAPPPQPKPAKKAAPAAGAERERPFKIDLPSREQQSPADKFEETVVKILALLFLVFLGEGLAVAAAGFLSEEADAFITAYVYPAFSPTLGVFLLISVIYGLVKSRQGDSA